MSSPALHDVLHIDFHVYGWNALSISVAAERLRRVVPLPLAGRHGTRRGEYYRWSGADGADLLLQANVPDEDGVPLEPDAPAHAPLVYATGLPEAVLAVLATVEGLILITADVVAVPRCAAAAAVAASST